jgi:non-specific serine/threonine protein kinase/serine/threonine-protein kinase
MKAKGTCTTCGAGLLPGDSPAPICVRCAFDFALGVVSEDLPTSTDPDGGNDLPSHGRIGPYLLRRVLGEGGMGIVWEAEQQEPVRRRVALKRLRLGLDGAQFLSRFESERQALAMMSHRNIARALDAGCTPEGQPYFAMEIVDGPWITRYCDTQRLDIRRRLELFLEVCRGIQHAHQRGVIHRDIKPSNILIQTEDRRPVPKIIDFGLAKAMGAHLTDRSLVTRIGQTVGTPEYMSPEQAGPAGFDVDTRTDVYALGIVLYELLTGQLPFALADGDLDELRRRIREEEPVRPSARVAETQPGVLEIAHARGTDPAALARSLRGDLDWIVLKVLAKDRDHRYATPDDLAADIQRYLTHQPVLAGPPGLGYRARKFVRRHTLAVGLTAAAAVILVTFAASMGWQARRIARERDRADREARTAVRDLEYLAGLFKIASPSEARGKTITARQILDEGASRIDSELAGEPVSQAQILYTIGTIYVDLGLFDAAKPLVERSLALRRKLLGNDNVDTLRSMTAVAAVYTYQGQRKEAEPYLREALEGRRRTLGNDDPATLGAQHNLAGLLGEEGKTKEAEAYFREALPRMRKVLGNNDDVTLNTISNLGSLLQEEARYPEAELLLHEAVDGRRRVLGNDHPMTLESIADLGNLFIVERKYNEAEVACREALDGQRRVLGNDHRDTLRSLHLMGILSQREGKLEDAARYEREALEGRRRVLGNDHPDTLESIDTMAAVLGSEGKPGEGEPLLREALEGRRRVLGNDHPYTFSSMVNLGVALEKKEDVKEAEQLYREALEGRIRVLGNDHPDTLTSRFYMGYVLAHEGKPQEAESYFREALDGRRRVLGNDHPDTLQSLFYLGNLYGQMGRFKEAEPYFREALDGGRRVLGNDHPDTLTSMSKLADVYKQLDQLPQAEKLFKEVLDSRRRLLGSDHPDTLSSMSDLATALMSEEHYEEAERLLQDALAAQRRVLGENHPITASTTYNLGCLHARMGEAANAMEDLRRAIKDGYPDADGMSQDPDLKSLHSNASFPALVAAARKNQGHQR